MEPATVTDERISAHRAVLTGPLSLSLALVIVGLLILRSALLFGVVWVAVFGAFLLFALVEGLVPASVVLTPAGLVARTPFTTRAYAWADCHDFHVWTEGRRELVAFGYRGTARGGLSEADARRAQADRALPALRGVAADDLLARIEDYRARLAAPPVARPRPSPKPRPRPRPSPR